MSATVTRKPRIHGRPCIRSASIVILLKSSDSGNTIPSLSPFVAYFLLIGQAVHLAFAPQAERIAFPRLASLLEIVVDCLTDQCRARSLFFFCQFVQRLDPVSPRSTNVRIVTTKIYDIGIIYHVGRYFDPVRSCTAPDGQITRALWPHLVQPPQEKYFCFSETQIRCKTSAIPPHRGAYHDRRETRGGMRWTQRVLLTTVPDADGKVVWS